MAHTTCVMLFQRIWVTVWCTNAGANWRSPRQQSDRRTSAYCMRTESRRWPIWSVITNYCGYSGTDGPATEADGTGETDWIPVPSVPSWFRETRRDLGNGKPRMANSLYQSHMSVNSKSMWERSVFNIMFGYGNSTDRVNVAPHYRPANHHHRFL